MNSAIDMIATNATVFLRMSIYLPPLAISRSGFTMPPESSYWSEAMKSTPASMAAGTKAARPPHIIQYHTPGSSPCPYL